MGYVGIPSAVLFADSPAFDSVIGFQRASASSGHKIDLLNRGISPMKGEEPGLDEILGRVVTNGKFRSSADFSLIEDLDAVTLAIQTPFRDKRDLVPDFSPLNEALLRVGSHLSAGMLVVLESTVTPGTTAGFARELLEDASGLAAGIDFGLAHAPERVMVGRLIQNIREHDRVVGGIDPASTDRATMLYTPVLATGRVIPMTATAAEVTKTAENALRDLQIAAANELALYCEAMGVNFYDVRTGIASLKGEGITRAILYPGAGVGGHCLTKDSYHLERGVKVASRPLDYPEGKDSLFVLARTVNDFMPSHMYRLTAEGLARVGKQPHGARIALLGWAFLNNSDDARNTPSEDFRDRMVAAGATVSVHDPWVAEYPGVALGTDIERVITGADAIVIFTGHHEYRTLSPARVKRLSGTAHPVIVDGRNLIDPGSYIAMGYVYKGIGRGDLNNHEIA